MRQILNTYDCIVFLPLRLNKRMKQYIKYTYSILCVLAAFGMTLYCVKLYISNEDVSIVDFKEFNQNTDSVYPTITLCFKTNFLQQNLKNYHRGINESSYKRFLIGEHWHEGMFEVDFDKVTTKLVDYFLGASIWSFYTLNGESVSYKYVKEGFETEEVHHQDLKSFHPKFYISFRDIHEHCFSIDIPNHLDIKIHTFELLFNNSIFPDETRPEYDEFGIKIHYPSQFLNAQIAKYSWKTQVNNRKSYSMQFKIQNLVVLNRRDKSSNPCSENWNNYDETIMGNLMTRIGCHPPHWKTNLNLPNCSTKEEMKQFYNLDISDQDPPCKNIQKCFYAYEELDYLVSSWFDEQSQETNQTFFNVFIEFTDNYFMEIQHVRSFDMQSLIGNSGGYLGLFTGYALLQLPNLLHFLFKYLHQRIWG